MSTSATVLENARSLDTNPMKAISCMAPTPPRPATNVLAQGASSSSSVTNTPPTMTMTHGTIPPSYRLLYRGALSLPDSLLALDGLTFAARLDSPSKQSTFHLLENPLALALESMRGRPTLRFMGTIDLKDVYMDETGGVEMDIHPFATLSQIYFENMFCLQTFPTASTSNDTRARRSEIGVKVALGDSNGPETTLIVIFAELSSFSENKKTIRLCVARITQRPPASLAKPRGPRPDDPIPRKPPAFFIRDLKKSGSLAAIGGRDLKRVGSSSTLGGVPLKKQKLANGTGIAADLGSDVRLGAVNVEADRVFKVPELPKKSKVNGKGKEKEKEQEKDVFGDISEVQRVTAAEIKGGKGKQKADEPSNEAVLWEKANKNAIKRATIEYLGKTKDPTDQSRTIDKSHPDHKELYNFIYRGVCFALRAKMRTCLIENGLISRLIDMHALMYLGGHGGPADEHGL